MRLERRGDAGATEIRLRGLTAAVPSPRSICQLLTILADWSRAPVRVVLVVDGTDGDSAWALSWDDGLEGLSRHQIDLHLEVRGFSESIVVGHER